MGWVVCACRCLGLQACMGACMHGWVCRCECLTRVIRVVVGSWGCMHAWVQVIGLSVNLSQLLVSGFCVCPCEPWVMCVGIGWGTTEC